MRDFQTDTLHPNEITSDNNISSNGLLALKDTPRSPIVIEQNSTILPSLTIEDNTAQQQTRPLTVPEQRTTTVEGKETETAEKQQQNTPEPWYRRHWGNDTSRDRQLAQLDLLCSIFVPFLGIDHLGNLDDN